MHLPPVINLKRMLAPIQSVCVYSVPVAQKHARKHKASQKPSVPDAYIMKLQCAHVTAQSLLASVRLALARQD